MDIGSSTITKPSERIVRLIENQYKDIPRVNMERAVLLTQAYQEHGEKPTVLKRAIAFRHIIKHLPVVIREGELIVGSLTKEPRGSQLYPEFSYQWFLDEIDKINERDGDQFVVLEKDKEILKTILPYWKDKTVSELAKSMMASEAIEAMDEDVFTVNNYFYNGVGHISVDYEKVLRIGYKGIMEEAAEKIKELDCTDPQYPEKKSFLEAVIITSQGIIEFAERYSDEALRLAEETTNVERKKELMYLHYMLRRIPKKPAQNFWEGLQSFWFTHLCLQIESNGHSISPMRFDQYLYPLLKKEIDNKMMEEEQAQELLDCVFIKLNEINKIRDEASTKAFGGYPMFQNLIVGGQTADGEDATNLLSYMCIEASCHTKLPQPSMSVRVWNKTPDTLMKKAAVLSRLGTGMPAYYNDEVIIPSLLNRGVSMEDARDYGIIGCVEPQKGGKTEGWHDSGFFNLARIVELTLYSGMSNGKQIGPITKNFEEMKTFEEFYTAFEKQMTHFVRLLVNAENAVDIAHSKRAPLPYVSSLVDNCMERAKTIQEGGAYYNFTGPQGVGAANLGDSLMAIKKMVFEDKAVSNSQLLHALEHDFTKPVELEESYMNQTMKELFEDLNKQQQQGKTFIANRPMDGESFRQVLLNYIPKFGNNIEEVDLLTRESVNVYCKEVEKYRNPRGGRFQPGLYPASINVAMGSATGATPDGRKAYTPLADGVSPSAGMDTMGPTAALNSVAMLDHFTASNGTLLNQKFQPAVLEGDEGLMRLVYLIRGYFEQKGMHVQFNVISRETLLNAQKNPEEYKSLVVRVAGYSARFVTLDKGVQDDIINRTEQVLL